MATREELNAQTVKQGEQIKSLLRLLSGAVKHYGVSQMTPGGSSRLRVPKNILDQLPTTAAVEVVELDDAYHVYLHTSPARRRFPEDIGR